MISPNSWKTAARAHARAARELHRPSPLAGLLQAIVADDESGSASKRTLPDTGLLERLRNLAHEELDDVTALLLRASRHPQGVRPLTHVTWQKGRAAGRRCVAGRPSQEAPRLPARRAERGGRYLLQRDHAFLTRTPPSASFLPPTRDSAVLSCLRSAIVIAEAASGSHVWLMHCRC